MSIRHRSYEAGLEEGLQLEPGGWLELARRAAASDSSLLTGPELGEVLGGAHKDRVLGTVQKMLGNYLSLFGQNQVRGRCLGRLGLIFGRQA